MNATCFFQQAQPREVNSPPVAFSPEARALLTGSADRTARLWPGPAPVADEPDRAALWAQVLSGVELGRGGIGSVLGREE
jgi:hypothetical protein